MGNFLDNQQSVPACPQCHQREFGVRVVRGEGYESLKELEILGKIKIGGDDVGGKGFHCFSCDHSY